THSGVFTDGTDHKPKDVVRGENVNITSIPTIHRDPTTGYHDALYPIAATFNANNVWTEANYPTINYNYNGGR
ncbi:hypothetical protein LJC21_04830, partial [Bacteroides sp. OttesenSCG-928-E20]|nr:hypothetical protein [Bacteroides sp. OttesenSCG-928-E20]